MNGNTGNNPFVNVDLNKDGLCTVKPSLGPKNNLLRRGGHLWKVKACKACSSYNGDSTGLPPM